MKLNVIPGKFRLKKEAGIKRMRKLMDKTKSNKRTNNESKKEIGIIDITGIIKEKEDDKLVEECEKKIDNESKIKKNDIDKLMESMTPAERAFYQKKMKKLPEKIQKMAKTSFKEKYQQYYKALTKLPEHHDIPKVGPG